MTGAISVFNLDADSGKLKLLQQVSSAGASPAHLSLDRSGHSVLVANYSGGNIAVFPIEKDGKLGKRSAFVQSTGSSVKKDRQATPHAHEIAATSDNRLVLVPDLGTDELMIYRFDPATGSLNPNKPAFVKVTPGSGPRHFAIAPSGKFLYLVNELTSTVVVFSLDSSSGHLHQQQTVSTLPQGFQGQNTTAEIQVDLAGKFLYVSNRGDDSIAVFAINERDGKLSLVERVPTGGKEPRHFTLDSTGKWLFAANQNSDTINLFAVDSASGRLTATSHTIHVPTPVCVVLVPPR
jgi:6-phosphogluconolactonase